MPCAATSDPAIGGTCDLNTTLNSIVPVRSTAGNRAIWQLGQIDVSDGGADGLVATGPNTRS